jgi:peptidoglycan/xylan/chitin deacetylase (PgdA/CDA1 family)
MDKIAKNLGFPREVEVPWHDDAKDFFNDMDCRTSNMLSDQMKTFGLTMDDIVKLEHKGSPDGLVQYVSKSKNKIVLERRIVPEHLKGVVTYKYEDYVR